eukprot:m.318198 g.318198  ORF g.318198 m.318198 type:complete len:107 (+) comp16444_c0_seq3:1353-1673(+)
MATRGVLAGPAPRESARTHVGGAHKVGPASNLKQLRAKRAAMIHVPSPHKTWAKCLEETQTSFQSSDGGTQRPDASTKVHAKLPKNSAKCEQLKLAAFSHEFPSPS